MAETETVLREYREHLQDEADSAFLYRALAKVEPEGTKRDIYLRLADVEDRHAGLWLKLLADAGEPGARIRLSGRARALAWVAKRFGPSAVSSLMLREEGREVKGYLAMSHTASAAAARDAALKLARESAEHAETLGGVMGLAGEPWHQASSGGFLRNVVYGFNDGLTANFGLVAGVIGGSVAPHVILLSGIAGLIADSLSMGASGYLAAKSEREVYEHELAMESAEIRLMPEVEAQELALVYEARGVERGAAKRMADDVMRDPERALAEAAREELGIGEERSTPPREGVTTGLATAVGALIPVAPFLLLSGAPAVWVAFAVAMLSHFAVGAARSVFTGRGIVRSGLDMFVVGLGVAAVGYLAGDLVSRLF